MILAKETCKEESLQVSFLMEREVGLTLIIKTLRVLTEPTMSRRVRFVSYIILMSSAYINEASCDNGIVPYPSCPWDSEVPTSLLAKLCGISTRHECMAVIGWQSGAPNTFLCSPNYVFHTNSINTILCSPHHMGSILTRVTPVCLPHCKGSILTLLHNNKGNPFHCTLIPTSTAMEKPWCSFIR